MLRYLNMFILIGIALIGISLAGFVTGNQFLREPGQDLNPMSSLVYLGAGALMILNGIVSIRQAPLNKAAEEAEEEEEREEERKKS
jgi:hypothetical protein